MVVAVQKRDLVHVSLEDHDDGVQVLVELGQVEDQDEPGELGLLLVVGGAPHRVPVLPHLVADPTRHVRAQADQKYVVEQHEGLEPLWVLGTLWLLGDQQLGEAHNNNVDERRGHRDRGGLDDVRLLPNVERRFFPNLLPENLFSSIEARDWV